MVALILTVYFQVLAQRTTMGVITGDMFVNGKPLAPDFQRNTGYGKSICPVWAAALVDLHYSPTARFAPGNRYCTRITSLLSYASPA